MFRQETVDVSDKLATVSLRNITSRRQMVKAHAVRFLSVPVRKSTFSSQFSIKGSSTQGIQSQMLVALQFYKKRRLHTSTPLRVKT
jgi:hypothetical protein